MILRYHRSLSETPSSYYDEEEDEDEEEQQPELEQEQEQQYNINNKKIFADCTICNKPNMLILLPPELQVYSARKNYESWFCAHCLQIVNFVLETTTTTTANK